MFNNGGDQKNLEEFTQELFAQLITATRISNNLPSEDEYQFYASFKPFKNKMNELGKRILDLTQNFLQHDDNAKAPVINDSDDVDEVTEKFDEVVDFVDRLIEKVDLYAEESAGDKPKTNIVISKPTHNAKADYNIFQSSNMARPQLKFADEIDNSSAPFIPKITYKPNAQIPLDTIILKGQTWATQKKKANSKAEAPNLGAAGFYPHPYDYELRTLQYLDNQLASRPETIYKSLEDTPYTWIDTLEGLKLLADKLDRVDEIAIDLEAHAYRTFQGFVCLMQVSTRREDFIIDTLALRQHLHILNSSFTNPKIVKVLHGSDGALTIKDILWLQRDFGIYIVNLFDTGQASRVMEYPSFGLAYLLKFYCNVDADKKYQLADWRIRELPQEMIRYAREDTHYLLYIYDRMRNELISKGNENNNLLLAVLNRSRELCGRRYEKEKLEDISHLMLYNKILPNHTTIFNAIQMKVFAAVYAWRDNVARVEDESTRYVLPNHMMFEIAAQMPSESAALLSCCLPVPPLLRTHVNDLLKLIKTTKDQYQSQPLPQTQSSTSGSESSPPLPRHTYFSNTSYSQPLSTTPPSKPEVPVSAPLPTKNFSTPIANGYNTHTNTPSPVLTTEQLYRTAGWLHEDDPDQDSKSSDDIPATPSSPVTPRSRRRAILAKASTGVLFSAQSSSDSESEDEAKLTAALIRSTFSNIVTANFPSFTSLVAPSASIAKPSKPAAAPVKQEEEADGDDESESKETDATSSDETKPPVDGAPSKKVPRSMAEIYKLSNQNRKRNKEKKKLKEDSLNTHPSSPVVLEDSETSPISRNKKQKTNHAKRDTEKEDKKEDKDKEKEKDSSRADGGEDTVQFMKEIGWITKSTDTAKSQPAPNASTSNTTSNNNNNNPSSSNNSNSNNNNAGNASGSGDVKSSTSHTSSKPHPIHHSSHHHDSIASSPPRNKTKQQQQQQQPPHSPKQGRQQPQQHITKPHHASSTTNNPITGHSGVPLPNFTAFDYNTNASFGLVAGGATAPGQYYNPFANPAAANSTGQSKVNPANTNLRRQAAPSSTFRPQQQRR